MSQGYSTCTTDLCAGREDLVVVEVGAAGRVAQQDGEQRVREVLNRDTDYQPAMWGQQGN